MLYSKKGAAANGISMILSTERSGCKASQAADMLTVLLGKHLQPSPGSPYLIEREPHCFQFTEEPKYVALTGVSRAVKRERKYPGISMPCWNRKRKTVIAVIRRNRCGRRCQPGQRQSIGSHGKMLEAGFDTEESVNMLNSALYAQNEEEDHPTVDICSLDLYSGECEICKVGGAATFLKESGRTECIGGESLPLGIFRKRSRKSGCGSWQRAIC